MTALAVPRDVLTIDNPADRAHAARQLAAGGVVANVHTVIRRPGDPRPHLILERHGSMPVADVRAVLAGLGYGLIIGPKAETRLQLRDYSLRLADR